MALVNIVGELGIGKTMSLTYLAWRNWFLKGLKIYSNIHLFKIPYVFIDGLNKLNNYSEGYCVHPDQEVICNPNVKLISEVKIGDEVFTHNGRFMPVRKIFEREYDGKLKVIRTRKLNFNIKVTPEHPILVANPIIKYDYKKSNIWTENDDLKLIMNKICGKKFNDSFNISAKSCIIRLQKIWKNADIDFAFSWKNAEEINDLDLMVYPITTEEIKNNFNNNKHCIFCGSEKLYYKGYIPSGKHRIRCCNCKKSFTENYLYVNQAVNYFDENVCYLIGLFIADGHANIGGGKVRFAIGDKLIEKVTSKIKKAFGIEPKIYKINNFYEIAIYSTKLARIFNRMGKFNKKSPPIEILYLPKKYQNAFLEGYLDGDGSFDFKRNRISYSTVSPTIHFILNQILLKNDIIPISIKSKGKGNKLVKKQRDFYKTLFTKKFNIAGMFHTDKKTNKKYLILPISSIKEENYCGKVYNLNVEEDNSYVFLNSIVHNCIVDEWWTLWDARLSRTAKNIAGANILARSRKKHLTYVGTSQVADAVEGRIRKVLDFTFYPMMNREETVIKLLMFRGGSVKKASHFMKAFYFRTELVKTMFDTDELVETADESKEEEIIVFQQSFDRKHGYWCECEECGTKFFEKWEDADKYANDWWKANFKTLKGLV